MNSDPFTRIYEGKKVLVTGNTGFKGSWLSVWLMSLGAEVYGISDGVPTAPSMFRSLALEESVNHSFIDVRNFGELSKSISEIQPDFLFHLAAQPLVSVAFANPLDTLSSNVMGTANVLEAVKSFSHDCVCVMITSDKCYENVEWEWGYKETDALGGKDVYSASKGAAEIVISSYFRTFLKTKANLKVASARAGNVIGGGDWALDRIVPDCIKAWNQNKPVEIRSPRATRPWQHVLEPLGGYLRLGQALVENENLNGHSFNFGPSSQESHSVVRLIEDLGTSWGLDDSSDKYVITADIPFNEAGLLKLNCDKALFHLNWSPALSYERVVEFTAEWYREFYTKGDPKMLEVTRRQIKAYEEAYISANVNA